MSLISLSRAAAALVAPLVIAGGSPLGAAAGGSPLGAAAGGSPLGAAAGGSPLGSAAGGSPLGAAATLAHPAAHAAHRPIVVLDPGHNGGNGSHPAQIARQVYAGFGRYKACNTTGTNTDTGYTEHSFTWSVAIRVRAILRRHGVSVLMTRPNDTGVGPCVNRRAAIESTRGVAAAVAIHADGAPVAGHGFHVNIDSRRPEGASRATVRSSLALSRALHGSLLAGSGLTESSYIGTNGYYYRDDLAGLNLSTNPTTFLELGNMRNAHDARLESTVGGRARIAGAVAAGILAYLHR